MRVCNKLLKKNRRKDTELKNRVIWLEKEVNALLGIVHEQDSRITQLEIMRKLGN